MRATGRFGKLIICLRTALVAIGLLGMVVLLQLKSGAYRSEFGSHPDEPAHVVTGLMVHDYLVGRDWSEPMQFAENYYLHYPKVAFGHWPPVFYLVQSVWMTMFGVSRVALLLLMASLSTALAMMIHQVGRRYMALPLALTGALVFVALPLVQWLTASIMTEILGSLLIFGASVAFARYLEAKRLYRYALAFAILASLAILTKGTGLLLAMMVPFCMLFARRLDCLGRLSWWLSAGVVAILCAPFYLLTMGMQREGMMYELFSIAFVPTAVRFYSMSLVQNASIGVSALALVGIVNRIIVPLWQKSEIQPTYAAMGGLLVSVWVFHVFVPCGLADRHLLPSLPAIVLFMADGLHCLQRQIERLPSLSSRMAAALVSILVILYILIGFKSYHKDWHVYDEVALVLDQEEGLKDSIVMISSDARGEGTLIAEMALIDDRRPSRYVLRASKMLAKSNWTGTQYQKRFESPADIMDYLQKIPVGALVVDTSIDPGRTVEHHQQVRDVVHMFSDKWQLVGRYTPNRDGIVHPDAIQVYALSGSNTAAVGEIEVDLEFTLGRKIR
jgi:hypothetical protein